jgi:hypothetical protein
MAVSFCTNCGNKITYTVSAPNFCGKCGTKLTATASAKLPAPSKREQHIGEEEDESSEEFSNVSEIPNLSSLAYEIENDGSSNRSYQLGELFGQPRTFSRRNRAMSLSELKDKHAKT